MVCRPGRPSKLPKAAEPAAPDKAPGAAEPARLTVQQSDKIKAERDRAWSKFNALALGAPCVNSVP